MDHILERPMPDGGWNCRADRLKNVKHSSFHTTFNVLDGLSAAAGAGVMDVDLYRTATARACEFMLAHQLYRSDKTGEIIHSKFTTLAHPVRWHYDVLRGLDFMRTSPEIRDERLTDPLNLLESKRLANGRWKLEHKHRGAVFFAMEGRGDSRWNTLRALRVLKEAGRF